MERWEQISGQRLLERFGMTETGFPLSNPYRPIEDRLPGHVGSPCPGAKAALIDDQGTLYLDQDPLPYEDFQGELLVQTSAMFDRYLNRPEATSDAFITKQGERWFKTGDSASK
jgi:malonyl-CoA/methylmalonyl-CoA synthetase